MAGEVLGHNVAAKSGERIWGFVSSCGWVVASLPWRRGGRHRQGSDARVYTDRRNWPLGFVLGHLCTLLRRCRQVRGRRSVHRLAKTASRLCFGALVYTVAPLVATRVASGGTSAPTTMAYRQRPLGGRLPLGRKNSFCASCAAARLASSPRQQPTQTPEDHGYTGR